MLKYIWVIVTYSSASGFYIPPLEFKDKVMCESAAKIVAEAASKDMPKGLLLPAHCVKIDK